MTPRHRRRLGVLVGIALLSSPLLATAGSATPLSDKQAEAARLAAQLDAQGERLSALDEQYNRAMLKVEENAASLTAAEGDIASANARFAKARAQLARHAVAAYVHGGSTSVVEQLAQSDGADLTLRNQYLQTAASEERDAIDSLKAAAKTSRVCVRVSSTPARRPTTPPPRLLLIVGGSRMRTPRSTAPTAASKVRSPDSWPSNRRAGKQTPVAAPRLR